jgi:hypothetical protein
LNFTINTTNYDENRHEFATPLHMQSKND